MKKKTTHYEFKNPNFQIYCISDIGNPIFLCDEDVQDVDNGEDEEDTPISLDIKELIDNHFYEFIESLYNFCLNYNEKFKKLRIKKEHQSFGHMSGDYWSPMDITISVKNGVGEFNYVPYDQDFEHPEKLFGCFKIKKVDMMKFINDFSKKKKFNPNREVDEFKRVGNWYSLTIGGTKYNVIIQKESYSNECDSSSIIVYDEDNQYISPIRDRKKIYDKIESIMEKVDFEYDEVDED